MKQNYKISLCALLLVGAASMMTAGAQTKPTLAVFVVGMDNTLGDKLATQIGSELNRNSRYTVATNDAAVQAKLADLRTQGAGSIDRNALAAWGRTNGVSTICLVADAVKGSDHMFYAHLIDTKESKVSGRGSYIRTGVVEGDLPRVSLALSRQLDGPERRRSTPAPARSYPAELDIEMVRVEGGEFPARSTTVSSFSIGKYEVTRAQWIAVMRGHPTLADPSYWKDDDQLPMQNVSWNNITGSDGFLDRLNNFTGKTYRLPTDIEWEYAARGCKGGACENYKFSGGDNLDEVATCCGGTPYPVGRKKPNSLGIYDMSGSVWEWSADGNGANRYRRGGSYSNLATAVDAFLVFRSLDPPDSTHPTIGFRVALD
ncbi:MAG: formylglycine-generating enzyme family protein [Prevotellaceae bacterium]|jgi:hypothetical protein|nr:formylglycine-generating enzyme family protein [Prevotellaceae bacterium]